MTYTQDHFGQWLQVGTAQPDHYKWLPIGDYHEVTSGTYRLTFECSDYLKLNSFAWLRTMHRKENEVIVSPSIRVYPKPQHLRIEFPMPDTLKLIGVSTQALEIMKVFKRRHGLARYDKVWTVKAEQLRLENQQATKNTFFLVLENVRYTQDPLNPGFYLSVFEEPLAFEQYEIGRFYRVADETIYADPLIDKQPYLLRCVFTSNSQDTLVQPGTLKVRIIY